MEVNDPRLDYIKIIAYKYCAEYEVVEDIPSNKVWRDLLDELTVDSFGKKYECGEINMHEEEYELYMNDDIQSAIKNFNLDSEKLWVALIFVHRFVDAAFSGVSHKRPLTTRQKAQKMLDIFDTYSSIVTLKSSKGTYTIDEVIFNVAFRDFLNSICSSDCYDFISVDFNASLKDEHLDIPRLAYFSVIIYYLIGKLYTCERPSKWSFIAKLAYIMRYDTDERLRCGYELRPVKEKAKKLLANKYGIETVGNKEYYRFPIDSGKLLKDKIKKNITKPKPELYTGFLRISIID